MKRNQLVILALLFALLPVLSACDSIPMSDDDPKITGRWVVTIDAATITLDLQGDSNVTGTYTIEVVDPGSSGGGFILRGDVTGTYDFPNVTLFFGGFFEDEAESSRSMGFVNAEGTSLTLINEENGERSTFTRQ